jgi:hypothetical protein
MKKNNKFNTGISIIIIVLLFGIALIVVIAGYNFIEGFSMSAGDENTMKVFISALKGLSTISIGIFILILVGILVIDNSGREVKENNQLGFEALINIQSKVLESQDSINTYLQKKLKMSNFMEENELLKQEISAKNDNIKGLLYKIEALEEESNTFEYKVKKLQDDVKKLKKKEL